MGVHMRRARSRPICPIRELHRLSSSFCRHHRSLKFIVVGGKTIIKLADES